jgi:hypothetical protein
MNKNLIILITVIFLFLLLALFLIQRNDKYISPNGSDTSPCTWNMPCKTLEKASEIAQPGDVIHILEGFYEEVLVISTSGTPDSEISFVGKNAILRGIAIEGSYIRVSGLEVIGSISHGIIAANKNIIIENNKVHHGVTENGSSPSCGEGGEEEVSWGSGIKVERGAENIKIINNKVFNNCGEGIAVTMGNNVEIIKNVTTDNYSVNIYIDNSSFVTVDDNKINCTGQGYLRDNKPAIGIAIGEEEYSGWGARRRDTLIVNNIVDGCYEGIASWPPEGENGIEKNLTLAGNTIVNEIHLSIALNWLNENVLIEKNYIEADMYIKYPDGVIIKENTYITSGN